MLLTAACGAGGDGAGEDVATSQSDADAAGTTTEPTTTTATTTAAVTTSTSTTTSTTSTLPAETTVALDCSATDAILAVLADEPVFAAFGSDAPPTRIVSITAFDPAEPLLAGIWFFPEPQADGLARGIVWRDGAVVGDVYYLDGVDPIASGEVELLDGGADEITLEISVDPGGDAVVDDCSQKTLTSPISYETPLTIDGIGAIRPGMTLTEVVQATGHVASFPSGDLELELSDGLCFHAVLDEVDVILQMSGLGPESSRFDATVGAVIVTTPTYTTPSGIMVGTAQADVEAALGDQLEISPHNYEDGWYMDFVPNDRAEQHLRLRFVVTNGAVSEMRAGLAEWTSLVEGCA